MAPPAARPPSTCTALISAYFHRPAHPAFHPAGRGSVGRCGSGVQAPRHAGACSGAVPQKHGARHPDRRAARPGPAVPCAQVCCAVVNPACNLPLLLLGCSVVQFSGSRARLEGFHPTSTCLSFFLSLSAPSHPTPGWTSPSPACSYLRARPRPPPRCAPRLRVGEWKRCMWLECWGASLSRRQGSSLWWLMCRWIGTRLPTWHLLCLRRGQPSKRRQMAQVQMQRQQL